MARNLVGKHNGCLLHCNDDAVTAREAGWGDVGGAAGAGGRGAAGTKVAAVVAAEGESARDRQHSSPRWRVGRW